MPNESNNSLTATSDYIVKFEVEHMWKGTVGSEIRLLWHSEMPGCAYFPTAEIGKRYLVYADSPKSETMLKERLLEVTVFNRTSLVPPTPYLVSPLRSAERKAAGFVSIAPPLSRRDGSGDLEVLRGIKDCECLSPYTLPTCMDEGGILLQPKPNGTSSSPMSSCCKCLRRSMTSFATGYSRLSEDGRCAPLKVNFVWDTRTAAPIE